jgi:hypothetical protein
VLQLIEFSRSGKILTSASQTMPMKQKTMWSFFIHWKSTVNHCTDVIQ